MRTIFDTGDQKYAKKKKNLARRDFSLLQLDDRYLLKLIVIFMFTKVQAQNA